LWLAGIIGCLTFAGLSVFADVWSTSFLKLAGIPEDLVGLSSGMIYIGCGIGAPFWGIFSDFINRRKLLLTIGSLIAAILISIIKI
jgi:MFS family permease